MKISEKSARYAVSGDRVLHLVSTVQCASVGGMWLWLLWMPRDQDRVTDGLINHMHGVDKMLEAKQRPNAPPSPVAKR